ncbi:hypothetical protein [Kiloniella sp. b19]|uniref:hypothetical protein n=1 Tax=Kiloniella sp. GXU_MW_B19 TaxID=3141326 RepID=UPI0031D0DFE2
MEQLEHPRERIWSERQLWFQERENVSAQRGAPAPSEQSCALMIDVQSAFCAGAFSAVVIITAAIVQAQIKESGEEQNALASVPPEELAWLNKLRNKLVHGDKRSPGLTIADQWHNRGEWEDKARRAILIAFDVLYPEQGKGATRRIRKVVREG